VFGYDAPVDGTGLLRWRTDEGSPGQEAMFPAIERHVGTGEYRGMEFFHVAARSLINTLPRSGRLPFRHTVNAYRGCSHACTYCFARPTHDYLGLDIGMGFERQIVVKVNAVERLRAELRPGRWAGEPIAMGTNTDPYQRAEGRYRLTRGLVEVLAEHRNPFSLLTKSTLVLRDVDVLAEAARRTDVAVTFSIGTLDEEVWRATEPGTPHPRQRVAAITRLREAGVRTSVLVAPVLPCLSDGEEQLDAVVAACVAAGASSISPGGVLYLKPGVREVFLGHLQRSHPALVARYEALYATTSYVPAEVQARVTAVLRAAIARHQGSAVSFTRPVRPSGGRPLARPASEQPRQLGLDL
jgi:DNA repair photolyase